MCSPSRTVSMVGCLMFVAFTLYFLSVQQWFGAGWVVAFVYMHAVDAIFDE